MAPMATRAKITARYPTPEEIDDFLGMPKERSRRLAAEVLAVQQSTLEKPKSAYVKRGSPRAAKKK